jgi:hypothetical protein
MDEKSKELLEKIESATKDTLEEGGKSAEKPAADDDESLELPESETPDHKNLDANKNPSESKPESEPKPEAVPEPETKPDE